MVNRTLKERPQDPLAAIARQLLQQSSKSYPTFDRLHARKVYIQNQPGRQTFKIDVFMTFKGRSGLRAQHVFAFDNEEIDRMLYDDASGSIKTAIGVINKDIT